MAKHNNNEIVSLMHESESQSLKRIADYLEKFQHEYTLPMAINLLRELSGELEAQSIVVELRNEML